MKGYVVIALLLILAAPPGLVARFFRQSVTITGMPRRYRYEATTHVNEKHPSASVSAVTTPLF